MPTLLLVGDHDPSYSAVRWLAGTMPAATLVVVPETGHLPHLEAPDAFAQTVVRHLVPPDSGRLRS